jgi:hypothetical protein
LARSATASLETLSMAESDVLMYLRDDFDGFLEHIRYLSDEDQDLLLGYYIIHKTQTQLAVVHNTAQTVCSAVLRSAIQRLDFVIRCGPPTRETLKVIFESVGLEQTKFKVPLSEIIALYAEMHSFNGVADHFNLHRPEVRRILKATAMKLAESSDHRAKGAGAYVAGLREKKVASLKYISVKTPAILGQFRINLADPDIDQLFAPHGKSSPGWTKR